MIQNGGEARRAWPRLRSAVLCLAAGAGLLAVAGARSPSGEPASAGAHTVEVARAVRALTALAVLTRADIEIATVPAGSAGGSDGLSAAAAAGRRLLVGLPAGALITAPMLAPVGRAPAGGRDLRIALEALRVSPSVVAGGDAEVLTVSAPVPGGGPPRAAVVAVVHILGITAWPSPGGDGSGASAAGPAMGVAGRGAPMRSDPAQVVVTLSCEPAGALRIALAVDAGVSIRLLGHSPGEPVPAAQTAP